MSANMASSPGFNLFERLLVSVGIPIRDACVDFQTVGRWRLRGSVARPASTSRSSKPQLRWRA